MYLYSALYKSIVTGRLTKNDPGLDPGIDTPKSMKPRQRWQGQTPILDRIGEEPDQRTEARIHFSPAQGANTAR